LAETTSPNKEIRFAGTVQKQAWEEAIDAPGNDHVRLIGVSVSHSRDSRDTDIFIEDDIFIEIDFMKLTEDKPMYVLLIFYDALQNPVFFTTSLYNKANENIEELYRNERGHFKYTCVIPSLFLNVGYYSFQIKFGQDNE